MSHLSILPTVLRDAEILAASLEALGLSPTWGGSVHGFGDERQPVLLKASGPSGIQLGWRRQPDGALALVGDLQRISQALDLDALLTRITRRYAITKALADGERQFIGMQLSVAS